MYAPKPEPKVLHTLSALSKDAEFNTYMKLWRESVVGALIAQNGHDEMLRIQGTLRAIETFMDQVRKAPELIARRTQ